MEINTIPKPFVKESKNKYRGLDGTIYTYYGSFTYKSIKENIEVFRDEANRGGLVGFFKVHALFTATDNKPEKWYSLTKMCDLQDNIIKWVFQDNIKAKIKAFQVFYYPKIFKSESNGVKPNVKPLTAYLDIKIVKPITAYLDVKNVKPENVYLKPKEKKVKDISYYLQHCVHL